MTDQDDVEHLKAVPVADPIDGDLVVQPPAANVAAVAAPAPLSVPAKPEESAAPDEADQQEEQMPSMTIGEHLDDLRRRLVYAVAGLFVAVTVTLIFGRHILNWIEMPYRLAMTAVGRSPDLKMLDVTGAFSMYLKVATYAGLVLASPWIFYQLWSFVGAGLYHRERKYVQMAIPFSVLLFVGGAAFAVYLSIPAIEFFIKFGGDMGLEPIITLTAYVEFMTNLVLAFGIVFQMPLVVLTLAKVGIVSMKGLNHYRKHVIAGIAVVAAVLAPPDAVSMILMAVPMWVLYEFGVVLAWVLVFRKRPKEELVEED